MKQDHLVRRYALLCAGLLVMAFGVAFSIKAGLGTSPISSLPYVLSRITPMTVGVGVSCEVGADVVTLAGEGMVLAVCQVFGTPFPKTKVGFDCTLVVLALIIGLIGLGTPVGVQEGTVAAAVCVGLVSKQVTRFALAPLCARLFGATAKADSE